MNVEIIKSRYPKSYSKLVDWSTNLITQTGGLPKEMIDNLKTRIDEILMPMLTYNIRSLYDYFDLYNIFLNVQVVQTSDWRWDVNGVDSTIVYGNRKAAEEKGFLEAFSLLEKELS